MTISLGLLQVGLLLLAAVLAGVAAAAGSRLLLLRTHMLVPREEWHRLMVSRDAALRDAFDHRRQARELESALIALSGELARTEEAIAATATARRAGTEDGPTSLTVV